MPPDLEALHWLLVIERTTMKIRDTLIVIAIAPFAFVFGLLLALVLAVILGPVFVLALAVAMVDITLAKVFRRKTWAEQEQLRKKEARRADIAAKTIERLKRFSEGFNLDGSITVPYPASSGPQPIEFEDYSDCKTCGIRAVNDWAMRDVRVKSLGEAHCQECGRAFTVLTPEEVDHE